MASEIVIRIDGVDVTPDVLFKDAVFESMASGSAGKCTFGIKDMNYVYSIVVGATLTLDIDGRRVWGGWVQSVKRQFFFPYTGSPLQTKQVTGPNGDPCLDVAPIAMVPRALIIEGTDYNILFTKRFTLDKADPAHAELKTWPAGTHDDVEIRYLCEHHLDLTDDGLDTSTMVEYVGEPNPDARGNPAGAGWTWGDAMRAIARYPGAVWYIDPDKRVVYTDVDTPNAAYKLRDIPTAPDELGYREMEVLYNGANLRNDAMVWGVGQGSKRVKFQRTRDAASIAEHGLWQVGDYRGDLWRQASVDKRSRSFVYGSVQNKRGGKDDAVSVTVTLFQSAFRVAEKVDFASEVFGFADVIPVRRMKITFPTTTEARFDLVLSHYIDEPWNTFEFWFPPIPRPVFVIPITNKVDNCPVLNYPRVFLAPDGEEIAMGPFFPVFSDDFQHPSGTQPPNGGGVWTDGDYWIEALAAPVITDGRMTIRSTGSDASRVRLNSPISSDMQIICALDLTTWSNGSGDLQVSSETERLFWLQADGQMMAGNMSNYAATKFPSLVRGLVYVRAVIWKGYYTALKIWPQSIPEPFAWTVTGPANNVENVGAAWDTSWAPGSTPIEGASKRLDFSGSNEPKLMGVTLCATVESTPGYIYVRSLDTYGFAHTWNCDQPNDGRAYAVTWDNEATWSANTVTPASTANLIFGYFGDDYGPGYLNHMNQHLSSVVIVDRIETDPSFVQVPPTKVKVEGKVRVHGGRAGVPSQATVVFSVYDYGANGPPVWLPDPLFKALGRDVLSQLLFVNADWTSFDFEVGYSEYGDPASRSFQWGAAVHNPQETLRQCNGSGGPFMLPNGVSLYLDTDKILIWGTWASYSIGLHFCVPKSAMGGTSEQRICEGIPINRQVINDVIHNGDQWSVQLNGPYKPGTVEVTVDGTVAKAALDFLETSPLTGTIMFLNSFLNAREITVCYFPES